MDLLAVLLKRLIWRGLAGRWLLYDPALYSRRTENAVQPAEIMELAFASVKMMYPG